MALKAKSDITRLVSLWGGWQALLSSLASVTAIGWLINKLISSHYQKQNMKKLQDKVVLITGASSGLGEALAHSFFRAGCQVVLAARREDELQRVREDLIRSYETGPTHLPVILPMDVSELNEIPSKIDDLLAIHKKVDVLVSCAGVSNRGGVTECTVDVDIKVMLINYLGHVALTKALLPSMMREQSGHIVAVSSVQGRIAIPERAAYSASKHALQAFSDSLRAEVASSGIKVTVVSPGYIRTNLSLNALTGHGEAHAVMDENTAKGMSPEYVADKIIEAVAAETKETVLAPLSHKFAILLRTLMPSLYFLIMSRRAAAA